MATARAEVIGLLDAFQAAERAGADAVGRCCCNAVRTVLPIAASASVAFWRRAYWS